MSCAPRTKRRGPLTAYKYRVTGGRGKVLYVAADRSVDRVNGSPYYVVLVEAEPASLFKAGDIKQQAGMPAEIYIKGEERTALEYLLQPLTQILHKAGREG